MRPEPSGRGAAANEAAQGLLDCQGRSLVGQSIDQYLPALDELRLTSRIRSVRTMLECTGYRSGGDAFLAPRPDAVATRPEPPIR